MKLSYVMIANGLVGFGIGSVLLWTPTLALLVFDMEANATGKTLIQLIGAAILAYAVMTAAAGADDEGSYAQRLAVVTRLISEGIGAFVLLLAIVGGQGSTAIWVLLVLYLAFTVGYIIWGVSTLRKGTDE